MWNISTLLTGFQSMQLKLRKPLHITGIPHKVVSSIILITCCDFGCRVLPHGTRLGVIVSRVKIKIAQVLRGVFADTQIARGSFCVNVLLMCNDLTIRLQFVLTIITNSVSFILLLISLRASSQHCIVFSIQGSLLNLAPLLFQSLVSLNHTLISARIISIPSISLSLPVKLELRHNIIRPDSTTTIFCAFRTRPLQARLCCMRRRTAIRTRALFEPCGRFVFCDTVCSSRIPRLKRTRGCSRPSRAGGRLVVSFLML
mmetsp:Transcript_17116/g.37219  ORF Transcript_17116/g.37219 Transcript_17116/m.37219 type:complete len:258 (-) Transcript_17116:225-998(-)